MASAIVQAAAAARYAAGTSTRNTALPTSPPPPSSSTLPAAPTGSTNSVGLTSNPVTPPATQPGSLRNLQSEAQYANSVGGPPQSPQEAAQMIKAVYHPNVIAQDPQLTAMANPTGGLAAPTLSGGAAGQQVYNPAQLKAQGYSDAQIQQLGGTQGVGTQANAMQAQINATPKPTNSSLYVLEQALQAKSPIDDSQTDSLYAQAGIPTSGAGAYAALANNLQQHQAELSQKYKAYASVVGVAGSTMNDAYSNVLAGYQRSIDQYNHVQDQMFQTNQKMQDYENSLNLQKINIQSQANLQKSAQDWEASHRPQQYVPANMETGQSAGTFNSSTGQFTPMDTSSQFTIPGYIDSPIPSAGSGALGSISGKYESGNDYSRVSSGVGDAGGISYGAHQLSGGNITAFVKNSGYADQFAGLTPGSKAFTAKWQQLAKGDPNFNHAQDNYIAETHYQPLVQKLQKSGIDLSQRSQGIQEMIYSTGVQYGPSTNVITAALKGKDVSKMSDEQIITTVQNYKADTISSYFKSSSKAVQNGVKNRTMNEMKDLLGLVDKTGPATQDLQGTLQTGIQSGGNILMDAVSGGVNAAVQFGKGLQEQSQYSKVPPTINQKPNGPVDENGQALNSTRLAIRNGTMDQSTVDRMRLQMTGLARSGNPQGQQALDMLNNDLLYAKLHPPLDQSQIKEYSQAYQALQENKDATDAAGQEAFIAAYQALTGQKTGSPAATLNSEINHGVLSTISSKLGMSTPQLSKEQRNNLFAQAAQHYQTLTGNTSQSNGNSPPNNNSTLHVQLKSGGGTGWISPNQFDPSVYVKI